MIKRSCLKEKMVVTMRMMTTTMINKVNKVHDDINFQNLAFLSLIIPEL